MLALVDGIQGEDGRRRKKAFHSNSLGISPGLVHAQTDHPAAQVNFQMPPRGARSACGAGKG